MFVLGWMLGLAVVGAIVLAVAGGAGANENAQPATSVDVVKLVLGALLLLVAVKQWRGRPHAGEEGAMPQWMQTIDRFAPARALGIAAALSGVNPKNLMLTAAAAEAIGHTWVHACE